MNRTLHRSVVAVARRAASRARPRRDSRLAALALAPLLLACSGDDQASASSTGDMTEGSTNAGGTPTVVSVIDHGAWVETDAAGDPFAHHRPDVIECGIAGWLIENDALEIDTNLCNYLTLTQPSLAALEPGTPLTLEFRHFDLISNEPATAHVAVQIGDAIVWERELLVPGPAMVFDEQLEADFSAPAGAPVYIHLHNHGQNTYMFASLEAEVLL